MYEIFRLIDFQNLIFYFPFPEHYDVWADAIRRYVYDEE